MPRDKRGNFDVLFKNLPIDRIDPIIAFNMDLDPIDNGESWMQWKLHVQFGEGVVVYPVKR